MTHHPIRDLPILSYQGDHDAVAFIGDGLRQSYPYFRAETRLDAERKAETFRAEVIAAHEQAFIARQKAAAERKRASASEAA